MIEVPPVGRWQLGSVTAIRTETARVRTYALALPTPMAHVAGQHVVVRLTAPDGYTAQRSYSIASPPGDGTSIELTVERLDDGEVSSFLHDEVRVGDELEVRGPIGGWFVWDATTPAVLVGGGSGIAPLMAMLRLARRADPAPPVHLVASFRRADEVIYAEELAGADDATVLLTREGAARRLAVADLTPHLRPDATVYVCGSARFAGAASELAVAAGADPQAVRVERFGPSG